MPTKVVKKARGPMRVPTKAALLESIAEQKNKQAELEKTHDTYLARLATSVQQRPADFNRVRVVIPAKNPLPAPSTPARAEAVAAGPPKFVIAAAFNNPVSARVFATQHPECQIMVKSLSVQYPKLGLTSTQTRYYAFVQKAREN